MNTISSPAVSVQQAPARGIAAVHARVPSSRIGATFGPCLDQVYAAGREGRVALDGQNIFLYGNCENGQLEVDFGVGVDAPFDAAGAVRYVELPQGRVATATHRGGYARLSETHAAVLAWCSEQGHALAGPSWEVYGHVGPDEAQPQVDVFYLLGK